jgi:hypothetical protein
MNPLETIKSEIEKAKVEIRRQIDLLRELSKVILSRLMSLDLDNALAYQAAVKVLP